MTGKYCIFVAAPIVDTVTGKTIGMVRTLTYVSNLNEILQKQSQLSAKNTDGFESHKNFVINEEGKIVLAREENYIDKDAQSVFPTAAKLQGADKISTALDINQLDRNEYIVSYAPAGNLEGLPGLNWGAISIEPTAQAFAARRGLLLTFTIGTGITALRLSEQ